MPFRVEHIRISGKTSLRNTGASETGAASGEKPPEVGDRYFLASRHLIGIDVDGVSIPAVKVKPHEPSGEEQKFKNRVDNAYNYYQAKQFKRAYNMFRNLAETELGKKDWKTQYYLAKIARKFSELAIAFPAAKLAVTLAKTKKEIKNGQTLLRDLESLFGPVTFQKSKMQKSETTTGYIAIEAEPLINQKKKEVQGKLLDYLNKTPLSFPVTLYLPFGQYKVNEVPFDVIKNNPSPNISVVIDPLPDDYTYLGEIGVGLGILLLITGGFMAQSKQTIDTGGEK